MPNARFIDSLKNPRIPGFEWQVTKLKRHTRPHWRIQLLRPPGEEQRREYSMSCSAIPISFPISLQAVRLIGILTVILPVKPLAVFRHWPGLNHRHSGCMFHVGSGDMKMVFFSRDRLEVQRVSQEL